MHSLLHCLVPMSWSARVCICIYCNFLNRNLSQREWHTLVHCSLIVELQSGVQMWSATASLKQPILRCKKIICKNSGWCASFPRHWGQLLNCSLVWSTTALLGHFNPQRNTFTSLWLCQSGMMHNALVFAFLYCEHFVLLCGFGQVQDSGTFVGGNLLPMLTTKEEMMP